MAKMIIKNDSISVDVKVIAECYQAWLHFMDKRVMLNHCSKALWPGHHKWNIKWLAAAGKNSKTLCNTVS